MMKKKIIVPIMALALAVTAGVNYNMMENINSFSSLSLQGISVAKTAQAETYHDPDDKWWQWDWVDDLLDKDWQEDQENCYDEYGAYVGCIVNCVSGDNDVCTEHDVTCDEVVANGGGAF